MALLGLVLVTLNAAALPVQPALPSVPALAHAHATAEALLRASPGDALRLVAREGGVVVPQAAVPALSSVEAFAALGAPGAPAVPTPLEGPVARLLSATVAAQALRAQALAALAPDELRFLHERGLAALGASGRGGAVESSDSGSLPDMPVFGAPGDRARLDGVLARIDHARMAAAGALLLDAAMEALPALRAAALDPALDARLPYDYPPYLHIKGSGADTWGAGLEYNVMVDLGGDDRYLNRAAATGGDTGMSTEVLVDVGGNDLYTQSAGGASSASLQAQAASIAGASVLLDAAGSDTYSVTIALTPPPLTNPAPTATVLAQGATVGGSAALVDLQGPNTFTATASTLGANADVTAQGAATGGSALLLADAQPGTSSIGGSTFTARGTSDLLLIAQTPNSRTYGIGGSTIIAQGAGRAGNAALVAGLGGDRYTAIAKGSETSTTAQGGATGGAGLLVDADGPDTFIATATGDATLDSVWDATCPPGFICHFTGTVNVNMGSALLVAHGAADGGVALLADLGPANGVHLATAAVAPVARSTVRFVGGGGLPGTMTAIATVASGSSRVHADGYGSTGQGALLGSAGDDAHGITATASPTAVATSVGGSANVAQATATAGPVASAGQGYANGGVGIVSDPAGNDNYALSQSSRATAVQNGAPGTANSGSVGWVGRATTEGQGVSGLIDLGGADTYGAVPSGQGGANGRCWTNSPPGLPSDRSVAFGIDNDGVSVLTAPSCAGPIPPN